MGGDSRYRQPGERLHLPGDVTNAQARVDEEGPVPALQEVAVGLLPVAVLADNVGAVVDFVDCKPVAHGVFPFSSVFA